MLTRSSAHVLTTTRFKCDSVFAAPTVVTVQAPTAGATDGALFLHHLPTLRCGPLVEVFQVLHLGDRTMCTPGFPSTISIFCAIVRA